MELQREAEFDGIGDVMFPPFCPAVPIFFTMEGKTFKITQDAKGMWYLALPKYSNTPRLSNQRILPYCMYCEIGWS
jgi:hypothetical protein